MKELGEYLRHTRISNGVSIEEAADDIELSSLELENIESGNTRAFKDIYELKEYIKSYAKYLGLDPDKVMDDFNDFLFEKTSKISVEDILEAKKKMEDKEVAKIKSPYTMEYKKKRDLRPLIIVLSIVLIIGVVTYAVVNIVNRDPVVSSELSEGEMNYELTY